METRSPLSLVLQRELHLPSYFRHTMVLWSGAFYLLPMCWRLFSYLLHACWAFLPYVLPICCMRVAYLLLCVAICQVV